MSETPSQTNHPDQPGPEQTRPIAPDPVNPAPDQPGPDPVREQPAPDEPGPDPAVDQPEPDQPRLEETEAGQPIPDELISPELAPRLTLDDVEPEPPAAPDLEAVTSAPPPAPEAPVTPPSLDLPGIDYAEQSARLAYGQPTPPASTPEPPTTPSPPADPYAASPYASQPPPYGGQVPYTSQAAYADPPQPQYGQAQYNQPQFGQPTAYPPVPYQQLNPTDESTWATAAHWSAILASFVGLGFLGPLLVMLIQGPKSARVRANAVESLNFEITYVIAMLASLLLMLVFIGFVTIIVFPILWLILRIVASVQTGSGRDYRYPVNIRLVK